MKKSFLCWLLLAALVTSCMKHDELYKGGDETESDGKKEEYDKNFPVKDIDPDQDWCNFAPVKVSVTVNEDWGETYTVKLYAANPIDLTAEALLLTEGKVKSGETFTCSVDIPKDLEKVWAVRLDSRERCLIKAASVTNGTVEVTFGVRESRAVVRSIDRPDFPYTNAEVNELAKKATPISSASDIKGKGSYVIPSNGKVASLSVREGVTVIVQGTLNTVEVSGGGELIVAGGGYLDDRVEVKDKSRLVVMAGSHVKLTDMKLSGNSTAYTAANEGAVNSLTGDASSRFINVGRIDIDKVDVVNLENYCYMVLTSNFSQTSTIYNLIMGNSSYLKAGSLQSTKIGASSSGTEKSGEWHLGNLSVIEVDSYFKAVRTNIIGPESSDYALLRINGNYEYNCENNMNSNGEITAGYIINSVYVEVPKIDKNTTYYYKLEEALNAGGPILLGQTVKGNGAATVSLLHNAPVEIPGSDCTEGNTPSGGGDLPSDTKIKYTFAFEDLGSIGDYDFNDVVIQLVKSDEEGRAEVYLAAAGGQLPVEVQLWNDETQSYISLWGEVHAAFGVPVTTMVNTGRGDVKTTLPKKEIYVDYFKDRSFSRAEFKIIVSVAEGDAESVILSQSATTGKVPQCLRVGGNWKWPLETKSIIAAYPDFAKWGQGDGGKDWYQHPDKNLIYNK